METLEQIAEPVEIENPRPETENYRPNNFEMLYGSQYDPMEHEYCLITEGEDRGF